MDAAWLRQRLNPGCTRGVASAAAAADIHVMLCLFLSFPASNTPAEPGQGLNSFSVTFADAAECIKKCLEVDLTSLPTRNEVFFVTADLPHGKYRPTKAARLLGRIPEAPATHPHGGHSTFLMV